MDTHTSALLAIMLNQRKKKGLNQDRVAEAMGIGKSTLSEMERGKSGVSLDRWIQWCNILGISPSTVLRKWEESSEDFMEMVKEQRDGYYGTIDALIKYGFARELETLMQVLDGIVGQEKQARWQKRMKRKYGGFSKGRSFRDSEDE